MNAKKKVKNKDAYLLSIELKTISLLISRKERSARHKFQILFRWLIFLIPAVTCTNSLNFDKNRNTPSY